MRNKLMLLFVFICSFASAPECAATDGNFRLLDKDFGFNSDSSESPNSPSPSEKPLQDSPSSIKEELCNGNTPRQYITYRVVYKAPKISGAPLDTAETAEKLAIDKMRKYLKDQFFFVAGRPTMPHVVNLKLNGGYTLEKALEVPEIESLKEMEDEYTFKIPYKTALKSDGKYGLQYWGYDDETGKFMPSKALEHQETMWQQVLRSQTEIHEAPGPNESTIFDLKLSLDMFCKYAVRVTDLISN